MKQERLDVGSALVLMLFVGVMAAIIYAYGTGLVTRNWLEGALR